MFRVQRGWSHLVGAIGTTSFDGDQMVQTQNPFTYAGASKALPGAPPISNLTMQFQFTEMAGLGTYAVTLHGAAGKPKVGLQLQGGSIQLLLGNSDPIPTYLGIYTDVPSATRLVHLTVDALGNPSLWIDGIAIPLVLSVPIAALPLGPVNSIVVFSVNAAAGPARVATYDYLFVDNVVRPPTTIFCCPGGTPAA